MANATGAGVARASYVLSVIEMRGATQLIVISTESKNAIFAVAEKSPGREHTIFCVNKQIDSVSTQLIKYIFSFGTVFRP